MLISFSGLDGAGKTTLISELKQALEQQKNEVTVLTMYDDISFYSRLRRLRGLLRGEPAAPKGGATPDPVRTYIGDPRTDVSDKTTPLARLVYGVARSLTVRKAVLMLDLASLMVRRLYVEGIKGRVLIIDRYMYDSLVDVADVPGQDWLFGRFFVRLAPTPDAPIFVDVPAERAFARKPEYELEYLKWRRGVYRICSRPSSR